MDGIADIYMRLIQKKNINTSDCVSLYVVCDRLTVSHNPIPHLHLPTQGRVLPVVAEDDQSVAG